MFNNTRRVRSRANVKTQEAQQNRQEMLELLKTLHGRLNDCLNQVRNLSLISHI